MNALQPRLKPAHTVQEVVRQLGSFNDTVSAPPWAVPDRTGDLNDAEIEEYKECIKVAAAERRRIWSELEEPGISTVPDAFTLLPVAKLKPALLSLNADALNGIFNIIKRIIKGEQTDADGDVVMEDEVIRRERNDRLWWLPCFDFHTKRIDRRAYT
eukprot:16612-Heterococcus_DN1.PRE.1